MEEYLLGFGDTKHPKRKRESDFSYRAKKFPQNFCPLRFLINSSALIGWRFLEKGGEIHPILL
jgi:hypothetical protein